MRSPQTLSEADRRLVAAWAADCAERVLARFEAAAAAARAAGQAVAVCHMGAHAVGAAAYAARAVSVAEPDRPDAVEGEIHWQLDRMSAEVRVALRALPPVGEDPSGPLGPGLLASGQLGTVIRALQAGLGAIGSDRHGGPQRRLGQRHSANQCISPSTGASMAVDSNDSPWNWKEIGTR